VLIESARSYHRAGLCVLPAKRVEKRPVVGSWKRYQEHSPTETELLELMTNNHDAICVICGKTSGNIEIIDFDFGGEMFSSWQDRMPADLRNRLVVERTPSGGYHVIYRCDVPVCGNMKLAQREIDNKIVTLIETRGEGGLFLCAPTPGYQMIRGDLCDLPVLTEDERESLLLTAWEMNECKTTTTNDWGGRKMDDSLKAHFSGQSPDCGRPGDDFNVRGDVVGILEQHGWTRIKGIGFEGNEHWRRPGKDFGTSATMKDRIFYVFSSNAAPFEPNRAYSPFAVYTLLNHGGDFEQAASALMISGYGDDSTSVRDVDISGILDNIDKKKPRGSHRSSDVDAAVDPGLIPVEMLRVPGFVSEVMDYCLATAPYPNQVMAFAGAISLLAFLAGRKVRDRGDNRTNIYMLGLAHSASGKDWPRKINTRILHEVGLSDALGERFASGEGIQDAMFLMPSMLFQTDEIDGMLQSINKARDARHEAIMETMLTMYSSANSVFPMRRKAGMESPGAIDQPCLVIYGTAIPNHYYEALSERMLTNGFFARMIILESGPRSEGQEPGIIDIPRRIIDTAKWWADYRPGKQRGNLMDLHPVPAVVEYTDEARSLLIETRKDADTEYAAAESKNDSAGTTVWGRVSEQTRKLAMLYAISEDHQSPSIGIEAVKWASQFMMHQTRRMLFMAAGHVAENPFHAECLKMTKMLRDAPGHELPHSVLLRRMKTDAKAFGALIATLCQQGDVEIVSITTSGRPKRSYRLSC